MKKWKIVFNLMMKIFIKSINKWKLEKKMISRVFTFREKNYFSELLFSGQAEREDCCSTFSSPDIYFQIIANYQKRKSWFLTFQFTADQLLNWTEFYVADKKKIGVMCIHWNHKPAKWYQKPAFCGSRTNIIS